MFRLRIFFALLACLSITSSLFAITDEAIFRSFEFSFLNPGARAGAMGGAFIALADDATAAESNPAGLTILTKPEVSLEYRHTEFDADELNSLEVIAPPGLVLTVDTTNVLNEQDQPSFVSVVYPAGDWTFGFSRQEAVKQDADVNEFSLLLFNLGGADQLALIDSVGTAEQEIINWNFSAGVKLSESFSLGATVRYSQLDWKTGVVNTFIFPDLGGFEIVGSETSIDDSDNGFGFTVGGLWKSKHASFGAVYKRNPKFEVVENEEGALVPDGARQFANVLKVPDTFGGGIAIKPNDNLTLTGDVVYIRYEDLTEDFQAGHSIFTLSYTNDNLTYKVENGIDYRVGTEFITFVGNTPIALRAGYYRKASNTLVLESFSNILPGDELLLPAIFAQEREDTNHFTFGNGIVFGSNFQIDWAMDVSNLDDAFILSSVVRF